ncbi:MAG: MtrB/PioB family decaheme-associated outer membrane protein [Magnetococcus sp. DMHC-1]|nr:MtrB/PioB family decaheme-associated outer membrane protein [Magnetococcales bacterium]
MRMNGNARFIWTTGVAVLLLGSGTAWSGEENKADPGGPFGMCPTAVPYTTPESFLTLGVGYLDGNRRKFSTFDGKSSTTGMFLLDAGYLSRDEATGTWSVIEGRNLGLTGNRDVKLSFERQGIWGVRVDYIEIPRLAPYDVNSKTEGLGTSQQIIPKTATSDDGSPRQIRTDRDRLVVNTFRTWNKNIKFNLNFRNETKEGTRQWGRGGFNEFALEPIDWTMRQLEPTVSYTGKRGQLLGGYNGSWFTNENNTLVDFILKGDNPALLASHSYITQPMDNEAHQVFLSGGYHLPMDSHATFKISHGRAMQNEHLPTNDIAGLSLAYAPSKLRGRVDTTMIQLGLTTQPLADLNIVTKLRYHDDDDQTPAWLVVNTPTTQVHATPLSIRTTSGLLEGTYRLPYQISLTGGIELKDQKRQIPFGNDANKDGLDDERFIPWRTDIDETTYRLQVQRHMSETINGALGYEHTDRNGSQYLNSTKIMGNDFGKIAPSFIADRERDKVRLALDWRPVERLGFQLVVEDIVDQYGLNQIPYGQKKAHSQLYSVDMDYAPTDRWLLTGWYSYDTNKTWQDAGRWSSTGVHEADRSSILKDMGSSVGLGVRNQWHDGVKLGADFQWTRDKSKYEDTITVDPKSVLPAYPAGVTPLPDIVTPTTRLNTFIEYKGMGPGTLRFDYLHERWHTNDWTWKFSDGSPYVYGTTTDGTLISTMDGQTSNFFGLRYTTRFK